MATPIQQALTLAKNRGVLPSALGSADLAQIAASLEERAFWAARTTHAAYLRDLKKLVDRYVRGEGLDNDLAQLRIEARRLLVRYGYTPEKGFPGDAALGVPAAQPASLQDLGSERRLDLIFDTQSKLMRGLGQKIRGMDRIDSFPAWELVRMEARRVPRDWEERFAIAGDAVSNAGVIPVEGRLLALKTSPIWPALGSRDLFADALGVDHAPFAFNSGMTLREVSLSELRGVGYLPDIAPAPRLKKSLPGVSAEPPSWVAASDFIGGNATINRLKAELAARRAARG